MSRRKSQQVPYRNNYSTDSLELKDFFSFFIKKINELFPRLLCTLTVLFLQCVYFRYNFAISHKILQKTKQAEPDSGPACWLTFNYFAGVTEVMWGFTPLYQYKKPSRSILSPIFRFLTALYTSESTPHRSLSTVKV